MSKKVLIISPHFPPVNAPDHQRVRMMLPYLRGSGWEAHVLAVNPDFVEAGRDPLLLRTVPADCRVTRTKAFSTKFTSLIGMHTLGWRALPFFASEGDRILKAEKFDIVFFSTTMFPIFILGPRWLERFGVPYVIDLQDPWVSLYRHKKIPPGGRVKYALAQVFGRIFEPEVMKKSAHIITVSPEYPRMLMRRYPSLSGDRFTVLPFGAAENDFDILPTLGVKQTIFDFKDGKKHWVYVGRGGDDMAFGLRTLFMAIQRERIRDPISWRDIKLHFVGTSYATSDRAKKTVEPIARDAGIGDIVEEHTKRVPYFEGLQILKDAHVIMVIGSDDPGYAASKIFPCILAGRPILALFHEQSSVVSVLKASSNARVVTFQGLENISGLLDRLTAAVRNLSNYSCGGITAINEMAFLPFTAGEMTKKLCSIFSMGEE